MKPSDVYRSRTLEICLSLPLRFILYATMKCVPDLDIFYIYTGLRFIGSRSQILRKAVANPQTRDLIWLFLAVNEIPWKRIRLPKRYQSHCTRQGKKATELGVLWRSYTRYCLDRPFRVWYPKEANQHNPTVSRSEEQRWRESILLRRKQLKNSSLP